MTICSSYWNLPQSYSWCSDEPIGPLKCEASGEVYGKVMGKEDSTQDIRGKCIGIFFGSALITIPRLISRIGFLFFHPFDEGYRTAYKVWQDKRVFSLLNEKPIPGKVNLAIRVFLSVAWVLFKDLLKLATLPLQTSLIMLAALYGLLFPIDARYVIAKLQELWAIDLGSMASPDLWQVTNFLAFCFLSKETFERYNLYQTFSDYHEGTIRSLCYRIHRELLDSEAYFLPDQFALLKQQIEAVRNETIPKLNMRHELNDKGELASPSKFTDPQTKLQDILTELESYRALLKKRANNNWHSETPPNYLIQLFNTFPKIFQGLLPPTK